MEQLREKLFSLELGTKEEKSKRLVKLKSGPECAVF